MLTRLSPLSRSRTHFPVIGFLSIASPRMRLRHFVAAFEQGLGEAGYVKGQNLAVEYRWAEGRIDRLPGLAGELVAKKVDLILASGGTPSARAAKGATSTIPIVFPAVSDPVGAGLVASLARPGGNLTGFSIMVAELMPKRIELLSEIVPNIKVLALLWNPNSEITEIMTRDFQEAASGKGLQLLLPKASTEDEIDTAFASIAERHIGGIIVGDDPFFTNRRDQLVRLASRYAVPAIYQFRDFPVAGGLLSYGVSLTSAYRKAAVLAGKVLKGAKPAGSPSRATPISGIGAQSKNRQVTRPQRAAIADRPCR